MEEETKYLYGAAVQGIQSFIFQTNELKDIVGASELVEEICTTAFAEMIYDKKDIDKFKDDENRIISAAGNIKYILDKEKCEKVVREFPKKVMQMAPGITISQAVVEYNPNNFDYCVQKLEEKLRAQRNKPMCSTTLGLMGLRRSRKTGLPAVKTVEDKKDYWDKSTDAKVTKSIDQRQLLCEAAFKGAVIKAEKYPYDIGEIADNNNWIAVVHADGNGLGQIVAKVGKNRDKFRKFSIELDNSTRDAAAAAFLDICGKYNLRNHTKIPVRPIVLAGDDFTFICSATIAIDYTTYFLQRFEDYTRRKLKNILISEEGNVFDTGENYLTACAGISFIKSSFPYYYAYNLAEDLCKEAKKVAKGLVKDKLREKFPDVPESVKSGLPASCLMFHKVQDSFYSDYTSIVDRELTVKSGTFKFGPYFTQEIDHYWTIGKLLEKACTLLDNNREKNYLKSGLRKWIMYMYDNEDMATQYLNNLIRNHVSDEMLVKEITKDDVRENVKVYPAYDVVSLLPLLKNEHKEG